jgi:hypothetical protein
MSYTRPWTEAEIAELTRLFPFRPAREIALLLGRSTGSVQQKALKLHISKHPSFWGSPSSGRMVPGGEKLERLKKGQFKAGQTPWNKGRHFEAGGRSQDTRFSPGNKPHTWRPVGSYRVITDTKSGCKQLQQKTNDQPGTSAVRWKPVARLVWEAANGPVPSRHLIVFKLGMATVDPELITTDRLECITRAENAVRNSLLSRSPELLQIYQLKGAINRQINRRAREYDPQKSNQPAQQAHQK